MADYIGHILVPEVVANGTFPLVSDYPFGHAISPEVIVHRFGSSNAKIEQRFLMGTGARRFRFVRHWLSDTDRAALKDFWELRSGPYEPFTYNVPDEDGAGGTTAYTVRFADPSIEWQFVHQAAVSLDLEFIEVVTTGPAPYALNSTETRFPGTSLKAALLAQVQVIIPLLKIQPREAGYDPIYLSDRRCTIGSQEYLPRLLSWSGISQGIGGETDEATFELGNADRVMKDLADDTDLNLARVEFSLFHVGTGIKLDLWAGDAIRFEYDSGPVFRLIASDGLYDLTLAFPNRTVSRTCWKDFKDGANCPYAGGNTTCDKSWANCQTNSMDTYFGGIVAKPQAVLLRSAQKQWITHTSQISDSIYDQPLPHIYTSSSIPVDCMIAAGREENEFYAALGIIGEGPLTTISSTPTDHTLDGQPPHGPRMLGLRRSVGHDPAVDNDPDSESDEFSLSEGNPSTYSGEKAAGVAFVEIRRSDEKGLQLSKLSEHTMQTKVTGGLGGWTWSAPGTRTWTAPLTNPVWVAINSLLRAKGLLNSTYTVQETVFDCAAAITAAAVCDASVAKLVGAGNETQYVFNGVIRDQKALRDWIQDILSNCLGYYTWSFGKLKIGVRNNSGSLPFTTGNILFGSLGVRSLKPSFNHLVGMFADSEYDWQSNSVAFYDIDHAKLFGGSTTPLLLKSTMNFSGCPSKSQCARLVTTRLREELGGVDYAEWKAAREISFRTTILSLELEAGMIGKLTHSDMPGGEGEFRITSWRLNSDYSVEISGRTTTDAMYDMTGGPKPADVAADAVPMELYAVPRGMIWTPFAMTPAAIDPLYDENDLTFGVGREYTTRADGSAIAGIEVLGRLPVNSYIANATAPQVRAIATATTGGSILGGHTYYVAVCAKDATNLLTPPSNILQIAVPAGTDTNTITVSAITWPEGAYTDYCVFAAIDYPERITSQYVTTAALPTSITMTAAVKKSQFPFPSPFFHHLRVKAKVVLMPGVTEGAIDSVAADTIVVSAFADAGDDWDDRIVSVISDESYGAPQVWNFTVTAYDKDTGTFTVSPDPEAADVGAGDYLVVRTQPSTATATTIGDAKYLNVLRPTGFGTNDAVGLLVRILAGTGQYQLPRRIISNTSSVLTVDVPFDPVPDATSVFIIEGPEWESVVDSNEVKNAAWDVTADIAVPVENRSGCVMLVLPVLVDREGYESREDLSHVREIYLPGFPGNSAQSEAIAYPS